MMAAITLKLSQGNLRKLRRKLRVMGPKVRTAVQRVVKVSAVNLQRIAKKNLSRSIGKDLEAPPSKTTGRLISSVIFDFTLDGLIADVGSNVEYSKFVEFGTGRRGSEGQHPPLPVDYAHGSVAGMTAKPYLFPSFEEESPKFLKALSRAVKVKLK